MRSTGSLTRGAQRAAVLLLGTLLLAGGALAGAALAAPRSTPDVDGGGRPPATDRPSTPAPATPTPRPSTAPLPSTTPTATPRPTDPPVDAIPLRIDFDVVGNHDVYVDIVDRSGRLASASGGPRQEGASVEPYTLKVENVDPRTLRLTWVDYAIDNALALTIDRTASGYRLVLVQPEPHGPVDTFVLDRVLLLEFRDPVDASSVEAFLQDGTDT